MTGWLKRVWRSLRAACVAAWDAGRHEWRAEPGQIAGEAQWRIVATFTHPREYRKALERLRECSHGASFRAGDTPDLTW